MRHSWWLHSISTQRDNSHNEDDAENGDEDEVQEYWANNCEYFDPYMPMEVIIPPCPLIYCCPGTSVRQSVIWDPSDIATGKKSSGASCDSDACDILLQKWLVCGDDNTTEWMEKYWGWLLPSLRIQSMPPCHRSSWSLFSVQSMPRSHHTLVRSVTHTWCWRGPLEKKE